MAKDDLRYIKLYNYYKDLIVSGKLEKGTRLPSIRRCCELNCVSKTTVEQAYMLLCDDGYVIPKSQSGYYVSGRETGRSVKSDVEGVSCRNTSPVSDYTSTGVDSEVFDLNLWTRYVKRALRMDYRLTEYGNPQGEEDLREQIARYVTKNRNCVCSAENVVIGAGVQTLLNLLCALIGQSKRKVFFLDTSYRQGVAVFKNRGFTLTDRQENADILYVSPSHSTRWGEIMSVHDRHALTDFVKGSDRLIIEDDYDSEFRDISRPTPSLQGLDSDRVVYIGTFSKLLLPSIRISYMILPDYLLGKYKEVSGTYSQTVSIPDQIALSQFISDGRLSSQIRRARRIYYQKSKLLCDALANELGDSVEIEKLPTPLYVKCRIRTEVSLDTLTKRLVGGERKMKIIPVSQSGGEAVIAFSVSAVGSDSISDDIRLLSSCLKTS